MTNVSLDGSIGDEHGSLDWRSADEESQPRPFEVGLVDECHLFVHPALLGGGETALPSGVRADLELVDERRINGVVYVRHRVRT